ncbi:hypothetical protein PGR6_40840 [Pseudomonas sp. GR 6-02]|nr:hypothetical protein PGR6_40840 [Pseudomonas sp. GR 6-02]
MNSITLKSGVFIARYFSFSRHCLSTNRYNGYNSKPEIF